MLAVQEELLVHQTAVTAQTEAEAEVTHQAEQVEMEVVRLFGQISLEIPMLLVLAAAAVMPPLRVKLVALGRVVMAL
jgi:hypothetical protein